MMASVPAVIARLARADVVTRWDPDRARPKFSSATKPAPDLIALIDEHRSAIASFLAPTAAAARQEAARPIVEAVEGRRPPDIAEDRWRASLAGLEAFLIDGWYAETKAAGWSDPELLDVPDLWSQVAKTGIGLLLAERTIVEVSADAIAVITAGGSPQRLGRRPKLVSRDQVLLDRYVKSRIHAYDGCVGCRRAIQIGQVFEVVNNGDGLTARFHKDCWPRWRDEQEVVGRRAMGLAEVRRGGDGDG